MAHEFIARKGIIALADSSISGSLSATTFVKSGGTSSQFLKADGSVDSTTYITSSGSITGNAATATTWQTARTLTIGSTGKSVNGSADVSWSLAEIGAAAASHTQAFSTITSTPTTLSGYGITNGALNTGTITSLADILIERVNYPINNFTSFILSKTDGSYDGTNSTRPSGSHNGFSVISLQTHAGDYYTQLGLDTNQNRLWIRSDNNVASWTSWQNLWSSADFSSTNITNWNTAYTHTSSTSNPHSVTASQVGLGNVTNESKATMFTNAALTGTPTAPTATAGTSTTQIATTAFVGTAVSNLVASAPAALDTLNELATALGNDPSFSTTITTLIGTKLPLSGGTMTGTVNLSNLTASTILELDSSKNIISATKNTAYNSNFSTTVADIKMNGTQALGSLSTLPRADHVHPVDTSRAATNQTMYIGTTAVAINRASAALALTGITSIDGSAATLTTARTLTIGSTGKTFNGSANVSWSLAEIGAAASSHTHSYLPLTGGTLTGTLNLEDWVYVASSMNPSDYAYLYPDNLYIRSYSNLSGTIIPECSYGWGGMSLTSSNLAGDDTINHSVYGDYSGLSINSGEAVVINVTGTNIANFTSSSISLKQPVSIGSLQTIYPTTPPNAPTFTLAGYMFNNKVPSGCILESTTAGDMLSYGINVPQVGSRNSTYSGGLFRIDTRSTSQNFSVIGYLVGSTTSYAERFSVNLENGRVGVGVAPSYHFQVGTDSAAKPSTNTWTVSSDIRLKENIVDADLDRCYEIVKTVPLKRYTWKESVYTNEQVPDRSKLGWIANDVQPVFPKAVSARDQILATTHIEKDENGEDIVVNDVLKDCLDLNADQMYAAMYGAIQKLQQKVEELEARLNAT